MAIKGKACWLLDNTSALLWALVSSFSFLPFPSLSHPPNNTHARTRTRSLFSFSMYYCSFLCSQPFSRRPVGLLLLLLFSEVWLFLHIKQEHYTMMWPHVPWLHCTTQGCACVGWIGPYLPRPLMAALWPSHHCCSEVAFGHSLWWPQEGFGAEETVVWPANLPMAYFLQHE